MPNDWDEGSTQVMVSTMACVDPSSQSLGIVHFNINCRSLPVGSARLRPFEVGLHYGVTLAHRHLQSGTIPEVQLAATIFNGADRLQQAGRYCDSCASGSEP